jgi:hypothetical protein
MTKEEWEDNEEIRAEFQARANVLWQEVENNPGVGIPVDPDLADYLGAFEEPCVTDEDCEVDYYERYLVELREEEEEDERRELLKKEVKGSC